MSYSFATMEAKGAYALVDVCGKGFLDAELHSDMKLEIEHLEFHNSCSLSDIEVCNISNGLVNLDELVVYSFSSVTDQGYETFFRNVKQLRAIHICEDQFTDATFEIMAKHCSQLRNVVIESHGSRLTDRAMEAFVKYETPLVSLVILPSELISSDSIGRLVAKCKTLETLGYAGCLSTGTMVAIANSSVDHLMVPEKCISNADCDVVLPALSSLRITQLDAELVGNLMWRLDPYGMELVDPME